MRNTQASTAKNSARDYAEIGAAFLIVVGVLFALGQFDLLPKQFGLSTTMSYGLVFVIGLVASVSSCIAVTGGLLVAVAAKYNETTANLTPMRRMKPLIYFNVGRVLSYTLLGGGGNITGVSLLTTELDGKRLEILMEAMIGIRRMAVLADPNSTTPPKLQALQDVARARGVELSIHRASKPEEIAGAIDAAKNSGAEGLNVLASAFLFNNRQIILPHVATLRLPAIYQWPELTDEGGLMGYGPQLVQIYGEIWSRQLAQLLRGTRPADIPIEQPTKFDLAVNLKTAKSLGVTFSESFLQRADKVIE